VQCGVFLILLSASCQTSQKKSLPSPEAYDLQSPVVVKLSAGLDEISGIVYYPKDSTVFAIVDEDGIFFKIYLNNNAQAKTGAAQHFRQIETISLFRANWLRSVNLILRIR